MRLFSNFVISNIMHHCPCLLGMEPYEGEKPKNNKHKGMTKKTMIIKIRSTEIKLSVKYNLDGIFIVSHPKTRGSVDNPLTRGKPVCLIA